MANYLTNVFSLQLYVVKHPVQPITPTSPTSPSPNYCWIWSSSRSSSRLHWPSPSRTSSKKWWDLWAEMWKRASLITKLLLSSSSIDWWLWEFTQLNIGADNQREKELLWWLWRWGQVLFIFLIKIQAKCTCLDELKIALIGYVCFMQHVSPHLNTIPSPF